MARLPYNNLATPALFPTTLTTELYSRWSGPSRGQMPAGARDNLLPRQCLVYSSVAGVSCNRTLSFRPVDNPTGTQGHREWAASLSASPVLG